MLKVRPRVMKVVCYLEHTSLSMVKIIRNCDGFKWFPSPRSLIGLQNWCHSLSQSDAKLKLIAIWSWALLLLLRSKLLLLFLLFYSAQSKCSLWMLEPKSLVTSDLKFNIKPKELTEVSWLRSRWGKTQKELFTDLLHHLHRNDCHKNHLKIE